MIRAYKTMTTLLTAVALTALPLYASNPYTKADDTWISISGTVDSVEPDSFLLDYGDGMITVEMDDGDRDADGYKLVKGDKVTVNGRIDDDFFETTTIEAASVYVENLGTYFYASSLDDEDVFLRYWSPIVAPILVSRTVVQGTVTDVDDEEFTLHNGARAIRVEVEQMPYNPLDDKGYQKIEVGDRVSVTGDIDHDLFEGRELVADSIVTLGS
jgi:uncharacterized protein YdeI (BOF family)